MVEELVETKAIIWQTHLSETQFETCKDDLSASDSEVLELLQLAREAACLAYAPYSKFRVGSAALAQLTGDEGSKIFTGSNVENASYGATMCAERVAMFSAVSQGFTQFTWMVLTTMDSADQPDLAKRSPCGMCRQVMSEFFSSDTRIVIDGGRNEAGKDCLDLTTIGTLLPWRFRL